MNLRLRHTRLFRLTLALVTGLGFVGSPLLGPLMGSASATSAPVTLFGLGVVLTDPANPNNQIIPVAVNKEGYVAAYEITPNSQGPDLVAPVVWSYTGTPDKPHITVTPLRIPDNPIATYNPLAYIAGISDAGYVYGSSQFQVNYYLGQTNVAPLTERALRWSLNGQPADIGFGLISAVSDGDWIGGIAATDTGHPAPNTQTMNTYQCGTFADAGGSAQSEIAPQPPYEASDCMGYPANGPYGSAYYHNWWCLDGTPEGQNCFGPYWPVAVNDTGLELITNYNTGVYSTSAGVTLTNYCAYGSLQDLSYEPSVDLMDTAGDILGRNCTTKSVGIWNAATGREFRAGPGGVITADGEIFGGGYFWPSPTAKGIAYGSTDTIGYPVAISSDAGYVVTTNPTFPNQGYVLYKQLPAVKVAVSFPGSPGDTPPTPSYGDDFTVDVTVTAEQPHGNLTNLQFAGGQPLGINPIDGLKVVSGPAPPGSFSLATGATRTFSYTLEAMKLGPAQLTSAISGLGPTGGPVSASDGATVNVVTGPEVDRVNPDSGGIFGGDTVTVTGKHLKHITTFIFDLADGRSLPAAGFSCPSSTSCTVTTPDVSKVLSKKEIIAGERTDVVASTATADSAVNPGDRFTFTRLRVTHVSVPRLYVDDTAPLTITGTGFQHASFVGFDCPRSLIGFGFNPGGYTINKAGTMITVPAMLHDADKNIAQDLAGCGYTRDQGAYVFDVRVEVAGVSSPRTKGDRLTYVVPFARAVTPDSVDVDAEKTITISGGGLTLLTQLQLRCGTDGRRLALYYPPSSLRIDPSGTSLTLTSSATMDKSIYGVAQTCGWQTDQPSYQFSVQAAVGRLRGPPIASLTYDGPRVTGLSEHAVAANVVEPMAVIGSHLENATFAGWFCPGLAGHPFGYDAGQFSARADGTKIDLATPPNIDQAIAKDLNTCGFGSLDQPSYAYELRVRVGRLYSPRVSADHFQFDGPRVTGLSVHKVKLDAVVPLTVSGENLQQTTWVAWTCGTRPHGLYVDAKEVHFTIAPNGTQIDLKTPHDAGSDLNAATQCHFASNQSTYNLHIRAVVGLLFSPLVPVDHFTYYR